ncbi:MAG: hypothetical protein Q9201_002622 [Fulgogasparrea decipioides]
MRAIVFKGPYKVELLDKPIPEIEDDMDIIVRVTYSALCESELHMYRGHQPSPEDFIMGHKFTGMVEKIGSTVKGIKKGDQIISPVLLLQNGYSLLFGIAALNGAQAKFLRVPLADATVMKAPEGIADNALVSMADIFPTGYFAAHNAFKELTEEQVAESTVIVVGYGHVGLCTLINAEDYKLKNLFAVGSVQSRLDLAKSLKAEP